MVVGCVRVYSDDGERPNIHGKPSRIASAQGCARCRSQGRLRPGLSPPEREWPCHYHVK